jgi:hypothetical protein
MRAWLTPSRVSALLWVLALAVLVWLTLDPHSPMSWVDEVDSVERLSPERACDLARVTIPLESGACRDFTSDAQSARLSVGPRTVCFLKAARWFVVDHSTEASSCPARPPLELERITDFTAELSVERRWSELVVATRQAALVNAFPQKLVLLVMMRRSRPWPSVCPEEALGPGRVEALDANLVATESFARWHFLTGDTLEEILQAGASMQLRYEALERLHRALPFLLLVDASVKSLPVGRTPGRLEASVALVDWRSGAVLCERTMAVAQPPTLDVDHGTMLEPQAPPQEVLMADFKDSVSAALGEVTRQMSDGGLVLEPTW